MEKRDRLKQASLAAWLGMVGNLVLTIVKGISGYIANSQALIADAVNSASDIVGSIAVYIGLKAAKRPPDEDHPYGHGKAENIAAIIVSVILLLAGLQIGKSALKSLFRPMDLVAPDTLAIYALIFSIVIKEILYQYNIRVGKKLKSDALIVNAYDHRSDVYSSFAALVGIIASIIGEHFNITFLKYGDPLASLVVAIFIIRLAWKLGFTSIHNTMDHVLHKEDTIAFLEMVEKVPGVKKVDELLAREHGYYVIIDIKVAVDRNISVKEGHDIAVNVKKTLMTHPDVHDVFVHINPYIDDLEGD